MDLSAVDSAAPNQPEPKPDAKPTKPEPTSLAEVMANIGRDELNKLLSMTGRGEVKYDAAKGDFLITDFEGLQRVAKLYVMAGMGRRLIEKNEQLNEHQLTARMTAVLQAGQQLGLSTFASQRYMAWVRGNPAPWGDAIPAIVYRARNLDGSPAVMEFDEKTEHSTDAKGRKRWRATCTIVRRMLSGKDKSVTRTFSIDDAERAGLANSPTWTAWEERMCQCRARSWAARDAVPDAMCGMVCAEEEMDTAYLEEKRAKEGRASSVSAKIDALPEK